MTDTDLIAFLKARLDEDEREALAASPGPWRTNAEQDEVLAVDGETVADGFALSGQQLRATVRHIVRHDPARVLRGITAKRAAINEYAYLCERALNPGPYPQPDEAGRFEVAAMMTRALAAEWDDRPDYREEWRP